MEFLELVLFLLAALILFFAPRFRIVAAIFALAGCAVLVALEFYVNLWVVLPIGNL